ncbi:MAG: branched-chain amino acid transport system substrate-binding protein [Subtercola sp.]|nr:branched-chain amino acid transport system substrate-binding protein [Subtercola sp.]
MKQRGSAKSPFRRSALGLLAIGSVSALMLAGCSADTGSSAGSTGAESGSDIKITVLADITGKAAFFGSAIQKAANFTADELNAKGGIDGHKIVLSVKDTTSTAATASSLMNDALSDGTNAVIFGVLSEEALAIAPLAQDAGIPMINVQAAGDGIVETGDAIWRITPPQANFYPSLAKYVATQFKAKTAAVFYVTDNAPSVTLATKVLPDAFGAEGITITDSVSSSSTETDLTTAVSRLLAGNPDYIQTQAIGAQNIALITQLRRAGYTGNIGGGTALGANALAALGDQANGIVYYSSFVGSDQLPYASGRDFTAAYEKATGEQPTTFNAETYDAFGLIEAAVKAFGSAAPADIISGMAKVAGDGGFTGAQGDPIAFDNRSAKTPGVIIQWENGKETLAPGQ